MESKNPGRGPVWSTVDVELLTELAVGGWQGLLRALEAAAEVGHLPPRVAGIDRSKSVIVP